MSDDEDALLLEAELGKYQPEFCDQARRLALLGLTDDQIADFFEVCRKTLQNWDRKYPEFRAHRDRGKIHADAKVAESLYRRALGYRHPDTHVAVVNGGIVITPIMKYYPPDTTACLKWLHNRQKALWRGVPTEDGDNELKITGGLPE